MALKAIVETLDDVPEALREHYKEQGDKFVLGVDGIDAHPSVANLKSAFERQKADNKTLKTQASEAMAKLEVFGDLTPEGLDELRQKAEAGGGKPKAPTKEELDAMVAERWKVAKAQYDGQMKALETERNDLKGKLDSTTGALSQERIFNKIKDAAVNANVLPKALGFVTDAAAKVWRLDEGGQPVAYEGDQPMMGATGPVTMDAWVESLRSEHPFLFEPSKGGGAGGSGGKPGGGNGAVKQIPRDQAGAHLDDIATGKAIIVD